MAAAGKERQAGWKVMALATHTGGNEGKPVPHSKHGGPKCPSATRHLCLAREGQPGLHAGKAGERGM